jgi:hypothetical protein
VLEFFYCYDCTFFKCWRASRIAVQCCGQGPRYLLSNTSCACSRCVHCCLTVVHTSVSKCTSSKCTSVSKCTSAYTLQQCKHSNLPPAAAACPLHATGQGLEHLQNPTQQQQWQPLQDGIDHSIECWLQYVFMPLLTTGSSDCCCLKTSSCP